MNLLHLDDIPPKYRRPSTRTSIEALLFGLKLLGLLLLSFRLYVIAGIMIALSYLADHYSVNAQYELQHVPRMRSVLYIEWPISYVLIFAVSLWSEGWGLLVFFLVITFHWFVQIRLNKPIGKLYEENSEDPRMNSEEPR